MHFPDRMTKPLGKRLAVEDREDTPRKRLRHTRARNHSSLLYNGRYHPMDDIMHPAQAARMKRKDHNDLAVDEGEVSTAEDSNSDDDDEDASNGSPTVEYNEAKHGNINAPLNPASRLKQSMPQLHSPNLRRSSRPTNQVGAPNYDTR